MVELVELGRVTMSIDSLCGLLRTLESSAAPWGVSQPGSNTSLTLLPDGLGDVTIILEEVKLDG